MKKYWLLFGLLFFINCSKDSTFIDPNIKEEALEIISIETLGGSKNDVLQSVIKTTDGGYATLGYTQSIDGNITTKNDENFDFWLLKFSADNTLLWNKTFGGSHDDRGASIIETSEGGFALLGYSSSSDKNVAKNAGSKDFLLIKLTSNGSVSWQKTFGFSGADYGTKLIQTSDNGFLLTGVLDVTASNGQGNSKSASIKHAGGDFWALKLDNLGNLEWSKYFGGSFTDIPLGIAETINKDFIIIGSSDSNDFNIKNNKGSYDFWVIRISALGNLVWEKSFGGTEIDEARGIVATNDGNFIIVGDTRSDDKDVSKNNGAADVWLIKISIDGNLIWEKSIGATAFDVARSISKTQDNGFVIAGSSRSLDNGFSNNGQNDGLILKVDANAKLLWQKTIGGSEIDFFYDVIELTNNTFIAVGDSSSSNQDIADNKGFTDALIVKIKKNL
jgi:hypothetical protein